MRSTPLLRGIHAGQLAWQLFLHPRAKVVLAKISPAMATIANPLVAIVADTETVPGVLALAAGGETLEQADHGDSLQIQNEFIVRNKPSRNARQPWVVESP